MRFNDFSSLEKIPLGAWIVLGILLLVQGIIVFIDASKRGENRWLWAFFAMLNTPGNLIIYYLVTRLILKSKICPSCNIKLNKNANYCHNCGKKQHNELD